MSQRADLAASQTLEATGSAAEHPLGVAHHATLRVDGLSQHAALRLERFTHSHWHGRPPAGPPDRNPVRGDGMAALDVDDFFINMVSSVAYECASPELPHPQRSREWLEARRYCLTASQFGAIFGAHPYQSSGAVLKDKLKLTQFAGNPMTDWGTVHEPHAREAFEAWFARHLAEHHTTRAPSSVPPAQQKHAFYEVSLIQFREQPWLAVSPDGFVVYRDAEGVQHVDLVEFKCPAHELYRNAGPDSPYAGKGEEPFRDVPPHYYAQIQGIMGYLNEEGHGVARVLTGCALPPAQRVNACWFVVWQTHQLHVTCVPYDALYYARMHSALNQFYFATLLPRLVEQYNSGASSSGDEAAAAGAAPAIGDEAEREHGSAPPDDAAMAAAAAAVAATAAFEPPPPQLARAIGTPSGVGR